MCKMVQEEKKIHALSSNQNLSPYSIQQMWPSMMQFFLLHVKNSHAYGGVYFIRGVRKQKKSLNTVDRGKNAYIRAANTVRTYLHINNGKQEMRLKSKTKTRNNYNKE